MKLEELEVGKQYTLKPFTPALREEYENHLGINTEMEDFASQSPTVIFACSMRGNSSSPVYLRDNQWMWLSSSLEPLQREVRLSIK